MAFRKMRPNHSEALPSAVITIVCDSKLAHSGKPQSKLFRIADQIAVNYMRLDNGEPTRRTGRIFARPASLWEWVNSQTTPRRLTWIIGYQIGLIMQMCSAFHLVSQGDWRIDTPFAPKEKPLDEPDMIGPKSGLLCIADPPTLVCMRAPSGGRVLFADTRNYVDVGLDKMAEYVKRERLQRSCVNEPSQELISRLSTDVDIVESFFLALIQWWRDHKFGMWRWTAASCSMAAFRHRLMPTPPVFHDEKRPRDLERLAYHGGEMDVFKIGRVDEPVWQVDCNSLYPHVMRSAWYPRCLVKHARPQLWGEPSIIPDPECCIAEVMIDTRERRYLRKVDGCTCSVVGKYDTVLCGAELLQAMRNGDVVAARRWCQYDMANLFRAFVTELWELRKQYLQSGDTLRSKLTKHLLNCLYGKFGQKNKRFVLHPDMTAPNEWRTWCVTSTIDHELRKFVSIGEQCFEEMDDDTHQSSLVAIPAFVTSNARWYMQQVRSVAGSANVYYQCCDSLLVNQRGLMNLDQAGLIDPHALGKFKIEHTADSCDIGGSHAYKLGDKVVCGWKSTDASETINGEWHQWNYQRLGTTIKSGPLGVAEYVATLRQRTFKYNRGVVRPDGWTEPHELNLSPPHYGCGVDAAAARARARSSILESMGVPAAGSNPITA